MRVAILTAVFTRDYGVTRVIAAQLPALLTAGHHVDIYACEIHNHPVIAGVRVVRIPTHLRGMAAVLREGAYDLVIAHTHPFYALLPALQGYVFTVAYEHGQPPPELYDYPERAERDQLARELANVQQKANAVATISAFAASHIARNDVKVLYNGADHLPHRPLLPLTEEDLGKPKRILCVSRFGKGEQVYKGLQDLANMARSLAPHCDVVLVGTGPDEEKQKLEAAGLQVLSFCDDGQLADQYNTCDALVSLSCFENFNLPLAEAGFYHKPALALNLAAHPEVTPFVFPDVAAMTIYLKEATRASLRSDGERMFTFVAERFRWEGHCRKWSAWIESLPIKASGNRTPSLRFHVRWFFWIWRERVRHTFKALSRG